MVYSAGGVVFYKNSLLLLKKRNGCWVLPKGHIEEGESKAEAALREVGEEAGVKARILEYLNSIEYEFKDFRNDNLQIHKTVYWFLMSSEDIVASPQYEEGFVEASYICIEKASNMARHSDERRVIEMAIEAYKNNYYNS